MSRLSAVKFMQVVSTAVPLKDRKTGRAIPTGTRVQITSAKTRKGLIRATQYDPTTGDAVAHVEAKSPGAFRARPRGRPEGSVATVTA